MPDDYYIILGIPVTSSQDDIKSAYRRLAKEFHPDCCEKGHAHFLEIQEAYSVLSDPSKRRAYDGKYAARKPARRGSAVGIKVEPMSSHPSMQRKSSPLGQVFVGPEAISGSSSSQQYRTSLGTLLDRFLNNGAGRREAAEGSKEQFGIEIRLTPVEASRGGRVLVRVPAEVECANCGGHGGRYHICFRCNGLGCKAVEFPVEVRYPPGISDFDTMSVALDRFGMRNLDLFVRFRVR